MIEVEHFQQSFSSNLMEITIGQCANIRRRLADRVSIFTPKIIAKNVVGTFKSEEKGLVNLAPNEWLDIFTLT